MFARVARELQQNSIQGETGTQSSCDYTIKPIRGPGATSENYQMLFTGDQAVQRRFFIKKYTDDTAAARRQLETDYKTAKWLSEELGNQATLCVDAPVLMIPEDRLLISAFVTGENLSPYFFKKLRWHYASMTDLARMTHIVNEIGAGLAELQSITAASVEHHLGQFDPETVLDGFRAELKRFVFFYTAKDVCRDLVKDVAFRVDRGLEDYLASAPEYCFQHNDFILQNLMLDESDKIHLFDFANATVGIPYFDIAHFISSLEDLTYLKMVSDSKVSQLKRSFMSPFLNRSGFKVSLLTAMRAYIQLYSGTILLSGEGLRSKNLLCRAVMVNPEERLKKNLLVLLEELES